MVAKFSVVRFTKSVDVAMIVESDADADAEPPPDTLAWLTWGDVAFAATFTVTVMGV